MAALTPFVSTLVTTLIPSEDVNFRLQAGIFAGEVWRTLTGVKWRLFFNRWNSNHQVFVYQKTDSGTTNPLYDQIEEYMVSKFMPELKVTELVPRKGEIEFNLRSQGPSVKIEAPYEEGTILMSIHTSGSNSGKNNKSSEESDILSSLSKRGNYILLESKTLKLEVIKKFVSDICTLDHQINQAITVFRPLISRIGKDDTAVEWDKLYMRTNKTLENTVYSEKVMKSLFEDIDWFMNNEEWFAERGVPYKRGYLLHGPPGCGKCLKPDTPVLMFDGTIKQAQDITKGDQLMGDDSTPRTVLSTTTGTDEMYTVHPNKGDPYTVNKPHVLSLYYSRSPFMHYVTAQNASPRYRVKWFDIETHTIRSKSFTVHKKVTQEMARQRGQAFLDSLEVDLRLDIPLNEYLELPKHIRKMLKGYKVPVHFQPRSVLLDPYLLGYWLGDGHLQSGCGITTADPEVITYFEQNLGQYGLRIKPITNKDYGYSITVDRESKIKHMQKKRKVLANYFSQTLRHYGLRSGKKFIPLVYQANEHKVLRAVLAGLIDSDGYYDRKSRIYEITQKSKPLAEDLVTLCRHLGLLANMKPCIKSCMYKGERRSGTYYRTYISGDGLQQLPILLARKQCVRDRSTQKEVLRTGIEVKYEGVGPYCGFELDGNHRFLLGDHTVTHNTSVTKILANKYNLPIFVIDLQTISNNSEFTKLVTEINYMADKRYIISIEDIDRFAFFKNRWYHDDDTKVNKACFMNFLDGIVETHGRVCIFTCNDVERIQEHPAVMRPGRIDKVIEVGTCDVSQVERLFPLFYGEPLDMEDVQLEGVAPAHLINWMCSLDPQSMRAKLAKSDKGSVDDLGLVSSNGLPSGTTQSYGRRSRRRTRYGGKRRRLRIGDGGPVKRNPKQILKSKQTDLRRAQREEARLTKMLQTSKERQVKMEKDIKEREVKVVEWEAKEKVKKEKAKERNARKRKRETEKRKKDRLKAKKAKTTTTMTTVEKPEVKSEQQPSPPPTPPVSDSPSPSSSSSPSPSPSHSSSRKRKKMEIEVLDPVDIDQSVRRSKRLRK